MITRMLAILKIGIDMNEELRAIAERAGAPEDMLNSLWFNLFCVRFADAILTLAEEEMK